MKFERLDGSLYESVHENSKHVYILVYGLNTVAYHVIFYNCLISSLPSFKLPGTNNHILLLLTQDRLKPGKEVYSYSRDIYT